MTAKFRILNLIMAMAMAAGLVFTASPPVSVHAANPIRISQVYGGGGNTGATYKNDFIELFNGGTSSVDLTGWSVQYGSSSGSTWTNKTNLPSVTLLPGQYYLIQEASGGAVGADLPAADATGTINLSGTNGKVILADTTTSLTGACPITNVLDLVGYGSANCYEGAAAAPVLSNTTAALRAGGGCSDMDNNSTDFSTITPPTPRNTVSTLSPCATDDAPTVSSTVPTDDATTVAVDTDLTVNFSEAVNVSGTWYDITCTNSGPHTAVVSGGPTTFTLNPDSNFTAETCLVTIMATQVTDQDLNDPPNAMAEDYYWIFLTVGADTTPPYVASTDPTSEETAVALNATITITFNEIVNVDADFVDVTCTLSGTHSSMSVDSSGDPVYVITLGVGDSFDLGDTCTVTVNADSVHDEDSIVDHMIADYSWSFDTTTCGYTHTSISAVQGSGTSSPISGSTVTVEGIIIADFQGSTTGLNGFYINSLDSDDDGESSTSEGLLIYNNTMPASVGDYLRIRGTVSEYENQTELGSTTLVESCGTGYSLPTAIELDIPDVADSTYNLEPFECMLVHIGEEMTVQQNYFQGRYGQITLGAGGRIANMHNVTKNGGSLYEYTRIIILDDANSLQNPNLIPYYSEDDFMRAGDTVTGVTGVLDEGRINSSSGTAFPYRYYRLQPTLTPTFTRVNTRPADAPDVGGTLKVVGFNTLNYFTTLDLWSTGENTFPYDNTYEGSPRGTDSMTEFARQQDKLIATLVELDADVYGLLEIESWDGANSGAGAAQALVDTLNTYVGAPGKYAVVADPAQGYFNLGADAYSDYIQTTIIYNTRIVTPVGDSVSTDDTIFDRSPFAQGFEEIATGEQFVVVANHFKSKGCDGTETGLDMNQNDGQSCWNAKRILQAEALLEFINTDLIPLDPNVMVIGDLNSYGMEDPIQTLIDGGLVNQIAAFVPAAQRYSYVFDGTAGYLDHALSTPTLGLQITDVDFWHINADEPSVIDYNTEYKGGSLSPDLYEDHQYRSSDHDPVLVGLDLFPAAPVISSSDLGGLYYTDVEKEFHVILDNPADGVDYDNVLLYFRITGASLTDITSFQMYDGANWGDMYLSEDGFDLVSTYGPPTGYSLPPGTGVTSPFRVEFATGGDFPVTITLDDLTPDPDLTLAVFSATARVYAYRFNMPIIFK